MMEFEKKHILLVDDNERLLDSFKYLLEKTSYDLISTATNGKEALGLIAEASNSISSVDLVVTDLDMPLMNGFELIGEINKMTAEIPTLVLSGNMTQERKSELLAKGCVVECLLKPLSPELLLDNISSVFER